MPPPASDIGVDQALKRALYEIRVQRLMCATQGTGFIILFLVTLTNRLVSFRLIGLFNGVYFLVNALFASWQEATHDLDEIKRRGTYRVYLHTLLSVCAYIVYTLAEDEYNKSLTQLGALFMWPLSVAWESRDAGTLDTLVAYLGLHSVMTVLRYSNTFWSSGWQTILVSISANGLMFHLAKGRDTVLSENDQLSGLCSTIKRLLRSMCDGYCVLDSHGRIVGTDFKLINFLGMGMEAAPLNGRPFEDLFADDTPVGHSMSEGLRKRSFNTSEDGIVSADVYTVASQLTPGMISDILGHKCVVADGNVDGFLCAVRYVGIVESTSGHNSIVHDFLDTSSDFKEQTETTGLGAMVQGIDTSSGMWSPTTLGGDERGLLDSEDLDGSASEVGKMSEAPSFQTRSAIGGFFPATKTIGIGIGEYTKVELVNRGAQGMVWKVHDSSAGCFAMKEIRLPGILWRRDFTNNLVRADREVRTLKQLQWASSVIVRTIDSWLQEDMTLCIVMEWLPLALKSVLTSRQKHKQGPPPPEDACRWMAHIVAGLAVIHSEGCMHRDIKPANLLLTSDMHRCKIADLGLSREVKHQMLGEVDETASSVGGSETASMCSGYTARCGTRGFQSPEILKGRSYDAATDIYSLGCVLFELLSFSKPAVLPMTPQTAAELFHTAAPLAAGQAGIACMSPELQQLCLEMLKESPMERPTALALAQADVLKAPMDALLHEHQELGRVLGDVVAPEEQHDISEDALGFVTLDAHGLVRKWSPGIGELLGVPQEKALGRRLLEAFVPLTDRAEFSRLVGPVVRGLSQEAGGPLTLQSASRKLRLMAKVRNSAAPCPAGVKHYSRRPSSLGVTMEFQSMRPCTAKVQASEQRVANSLAKDLASPARSDPPEAARRPEVHSAPAHLVSQRMANPDGFASEEGLHERHVRAWSVVEE